VRLSNDVQREAACPLLNIFWSGLLTAIVHHKYRKTRRIRLLGDGTQTLIQRDPVVVDRYDDSDADAGAVVSIPNVAICEPTLRPLRPRRYTKGRPEAKGLPEKVRGSTVAHLLIGRSEWRERVGRRNPLRVATPWHQFRPGPEARGPWSTERSMLGKRLADVDRNASSVPQCQLQLMVIQMTHGSPKFVHRSCWAG